MEVFDKDIRRAGMDLLARREHSFQELQQKLSRRYPDFDVVPALERLQDEGLQSDERFIESYVRSKTEKGYGPVRIRSDLRRKGLADQVISSFLFEDDDVWLEMARSSRCRKFGNNLPAGAGERSKQYRFLAQRGFTSLQISNCLKQLFLT
ncbi:regulatory protein RecX [Endozoicomonas sp. ALD040]|uniref:regulatory protein RecX n=1 Tax=unclassified Endozoicomonas TaxID=2644528 RepID=UPI003BB00152